MASRIVFALLSIVALTVVPASPVAAETLICENGFFSFGETDMLDDVIVRRDAYVILQGTTVLGNIKVEAGGVVTASNATIFGDVRSVRAYLIELGNCSVSGHVILERTGRTAPPSDPFVSLLSPSIDIFKSRIFGDVRISDSTVNSIRIFENHISGRLLLSRNTYNSYDVSRNRIDKRLLPQ